MGITSGIAGLSVGVAQGRVESQLSTLALGKELDNMKTSTADLLSQMFVGSDPNLGKNVDIKA